ncbi:MAG: motility protein A [Candidatus Marinamargulisbacteria bacterium]
MDITVLIGSIIFGFLLLESIGFDSFVSLFINFDALILVAGCTLAATLVHFPVKQVFQIWLRLKVLFSFKKYNYQMDIDYLCGISKDIKSSGGTQIILEKINNCDDHFLKTGLQLMVDKIELMELEQTLSETIGYIQRRHLQGIMIFEQMAKYAPSFGLLGTTIGLIQLLANLKDPGMIGVGMSIALISTFYGILIANFIFTPIAGRLRAYSIEESFQKEMLKVGILAVAKNEPTVIVREKMMLFLTKKERINAPK